MRPGTETRIDNLTDVNRTVPPPMFGSGLLTGALTTLVALSPALVVTGDHLYQQWSTLEVQSKPAPTCQPIAQQLGGVSLRRRAKVFASAEQHPSLVVNQLGRLPHRITYTGASCRLINSDGTWYRFEGKQILAADSSLHTDDRDGMVWLKSRDVSLVPPRP